MRATATTDSISLTWSGAKGDTGYLILGFNYKTGAPVTTTLLKGKGMTINGLAARTYYIFSIVAITPTGSTQSAPVITETGVRSS